MFVVGLTNCRMYMPLVISSHKELIALLEHEVNYEHVVRHGLPYCMASDDFDKFVEIGNGYIPADVALSTSMKARVGLLVEYGVNKEVPMTGKSD